MRESSWSLVLVLGDSDSVDGAAASEEFLDGPLLSSESEVANEDSVHLAIVCCWSSSSWSTTWSLSREFNLEPPSVKFSFVCGIKSLSRGSMITVLDECLSLGSSLAHDELALSKFSMLSEEFSESVLSGIE